MFSTSPLAILKKKITLTDEKIEDIEMNQDNGDKLGLFDEARGDKLKELIEEKVRLLEELKQYEPAVVLKKI